MPGDDVPYPHWPRSDVLDAEFAAMRRLLDQSSLLLQACTRDLATIEQRLAGLQLAYNNAADYAMGRLVRPLSRRELQVLRLVARGLGNRAVGRELGISEGTVKNHMTTILFKLHVRSRTEAARRAQALGII